MPAPLLTVQRNCLWHRRLRCIYVIVPKAATTSIKHWLIATNPDCRQDDAKGDVHDIMRATCTMDHMPPDELQGIFGDPSIFKFSFVRNPWTRLVSGYLDKVVNAEPPAYTIVRHHAKSTLLGWVEWTRLRFTTGVEPIYQRGLTFRDFVAALDEVAPQEIDWHFRPQATILADIPLDFLGRVENFKSDFAQVLRRLGEATLAPKEHQQQYQPLPGGDSVADWPAGKFRNLEVYPHWKRFYPPDIAARVARIFAEDITSYGYEAEPSVVREAA